MRSTAVGHTAVTVTTFTSAVRLGFEAHFVCDCLPAALLNTVQLCLGVRLLSHQPVRGVQRPSRRLRGPGPPSLAAPEPGPVPPRERDEHACRRDPLADDLQASGPRRYMEVAQVNGDTGVRCVETFFF